MRGDSGDNSDVDGQSDARTEDSGPNVADDREIKFDKLPPSNDNEFVSCISAKHTRIPITKVSGIPEDVPERTLDRETYASFGSDATTATVNAYGNILQISRYLGVEPSGFYCVDLTGVHQPYYAEARMKDVTNLFKESGKGVRLDLGSLLKDSNHSSKPNKPTLDFVQDRWPRYTFRKSSIFKVSLQYFCHGNTVFQKYVLKRKNMSDSIPGELSRMELCADIKIRNLDFTDYRESNELFVAVQPGPHRKSLIFHREVYSEEETLTSQTRDRGSKGAGEKREKKLICLIATVFADGVAQQVSPEEGSHWVTFSDQAQEAFKEGASVEITVAYKLKVMSAHHWWRSWLAPAAQLVHMKTVLSDARSDSARWLKFSSHQHLDFVIRRNLEYILSVCSIAVPDYDSRRRRNTAIALTCGDVSGHRVAPAASFFAFRFLTQMLQYINSQRLKKPREYSKRQDCDCDLKSDSSCENCQNLQVHIERLKARIEKVCVGHITWVHAVYEAQKGPFPSHVWPTGKTIPKTPWLSPRLIADTPFQIIKLNDLQRVWPQLWPQFQYDEELMSSDVREALRAYRQTHATIERQIKPWIRTLQDEDKRGKYVFSHPSTVEYDMVDDEDRTYRLSDHCWIFLALKSLNSLNMEDRLARSNTGTPEEDLLYDFNNINKIRDVMLKRFTTQHPVSQQRMLATTRTPSKSRFLFHSKDTALFYAMQDGFFDSQDADYSDKKNRPKTGEEWKAKSEEWKNTVAAQQHHEDNQKMDNENPLWYALALIMGSKRRRINKLPTEELLRVTTDIILGSSSSNGLFPGLLDERKEPVPYRDELDRDSYWQVTFEIPLLLWMYGRGYLEDLASPQGRQRGIDPLADLGAPPKLPTAGLQPVENAAQERTRAPIAQAMRKKMPFVTFNEFVDHKGLVELTDDWLQPGPRSLDFKYQPDFVDASKFEDHEKLHFKQEVKENVKGSKDSVIELGKNAYNWESKAFSDPAGFKGVIIDVPRWEHRERSLVADLKLSNNDQILELLGRTRTVFDAKKRIVWLPRADRETALVCYLASPEPERENMSSFFERHATYEKYFFDSTTATLNEWETELHLSFICIVKDKQETINGIPRPSNAKLQGTGSNHHVQANIERATMSFRFVGDFFDRYWTCHFLEYSPHSHSIQLGNCLSEFDAVEVGKSDKKKVPWQQRKVLELLLINEMLGVITQCTMEILEWAQKVLLVAETDGGASQSSKSPHAPPPQFSTIRFATGTLTVPAQDQSNPLAKAFHHGIRFLQPGGSDSYFSINERWHMCEQFLQAVVDDLSENLDRIEDWKRREKDREPQRPRWTRNDEKTYRPTLTKLQVLHQRKIRDLERSKASIEAFRETLTGRLTSIREDINFRGSENINLFTYVTVVFLPLGFATGVFSMNGSPDRGTLVNMIIMAVAALLVTIIALINAKILANNFIKPVIHTCSVIGIAVTYPILYPFFRYVALPLQEFWSKSGLPSLSQAHADLNPLQNARDDYEKRHHPKEETKKTPGRDGDLGGFIGPQKDGAKKDGAEGRSSPSYRRQSTPEPDPELGYH